MNNKLISALTAVGGLLILIIIGEWWYAQHTRTQLLSGVDGEQIKAALDEMPSVNLTGQAEESYVDLVARPLFIKGRKPVEEVAQKQNQINAVAVKFDWLLIGVYTGENKLQALLVRETKKIPKDNYRKITEGSDLDGWKLTKIDKDKVVFTQDGNEKILPLRKPKLKQLPNNAAAPGQPPLTEGTEGAVPEPTPELEPESEPEPTEEPINE